MEKQKREGEGRNRRGREMRTERRKNDKIQKIILR